jgi:hypothetical protein
MSHARSEHIQARCGWVSRRSRMRSGWDRLTREEKKDPETLTRRRQPIRILEPAPFRPSIHPRCCVMWILKRKVDEQSIHNNRKMKVAAGAAGKNKQV